MNITSYCFRRIMILFFTLFTTLIGFSQTNVSVSTATLINSFPHTETDVNTNGGGTAIGMNGTCSSLPCCSTLVYRIETPTYGSLRVEIPDFVPLAGSAIGYAPDIDNPQDWSDLTYYGGAGNFCGFRDTLVLGNHYNWSSLAWNANPDITDSTHVLPPGAHYVLVFNHNQQVSLGGVSDLVFKFAAYCPDGYSCSFTNVSLCNGDGYTSPSGNLYTTSGNYQDTLFGAAYGGLDSLIFTNLTINHSDLSQDIYTDTSSCKQSSLTYIANTSYSPYGNFTKSNSNWVNCNSVIPGLKNEDRSIFGWLKKSTTVSGSSQALVGINTSGTSTVTNLLIATSEKLAIYDGANWRYATTTITDGNWHFVGYTYDNTSNVTKMYVDGVLEKTFTNSQHIDSDNDRISLGQEFDGSTASNFLEGIFTQVSMWSTVLNSVEINEIMESSINTSHSSYSSLEAYYPMNVECGADVMVVEDRSPNDYYGIASHDDIQSTNSLMEITGFNAAELFTKSWKKDGTKVSTNFEFVISGLDSDAGNYQLVLNCDYYTITDDWTLSVVDLPVISYQPVDTIAAIEENAFFETSASGGSFTYQWGEMVYNYGQKTTADGLGTSYCTDVFVMDNAVYVTTLGGLSISSNGGSGTFVNRTTTNGLGTNSTWGVSAEEGLLCVATTGGLSISTDNGTSFSNNTTSDGLGDNSIKGVYVNNGIIYAATYGGVSISTDGGNSFVNKTTAVGIGDDHCWGIYESNGTIYVATEGGVSISTDGGNTYVNKTVANGLGNDFCRNVFEANGVIYVSTNGGLGISIDGGENFVNKTTADGLGNNACNEAYVSNGVLYVATNGGLGISSDGGNTFVNKSIEDGLIHGSCRSVFVTNNVQYVAVNGGLCISPLWDEITGEVSATLNMTPVTSEMDSTYYSAKVTSATTGCSNYSDTVQLIIVNSWDGSESTDWNTSGNWAKDIVPTLSDTIIIRDVTNKPIISSTGTASCNNLILNAGTTLTIESDATGTGSLIVTDNIINNGTITAKRYATAGSWHGISSPITGSTANSYYLNGNPDVWLKDHDESTNTYSYLTSLTTPLSNMKGFFMWIDGSTSKIFEYVGGLNTNEVGSTNNMVRSASGSENGWNFVGNPFTSAIDWNASSGWTKTNIDNTIYQYNSASSSWTTWNGSAGTNGGTQYVASGQGFFVSVSDGSSNGTLKMDDGVKVHNSTPFLKQTSTLNNFMRLELSSGDYTDETIIQLNNDAQIGFDSGFDAYKLFSFNEDVPQIYSISNDKMAVNSLPITTTHIAVDVIGVNNTDMTITLTENNDFGTIYLTDNYLGTQTNLIDNIYGFKYIADFSNRFTISFTTTDIENIKSEIYKIYSYDKEIKVIATEKQNIAIFVYNISGQTVARSKGYQGVNIIPIEKTGQYIVKVVDSFSVITEKVFIK